MLEVKRYSFAEQVISELMYEASLAIWDHTVLPVTILK